MRVNELASKLGVTPDTVRYYTRIGLLKPDKDPFNGYKNYNESDDKRLNFIVKARHLGFSVSEIQEIVEMSSHGSSPCCKVREIVKKRLKDALATIEEMQQLHQRMEHAVGIWEAMPDGEPTGDSICSLIETWEEVELDQVSLQGVSSFSASLESSTQG